MVSQCNRLQCEVEALKKAQDEIKDNLKNETLKKVQNLKEKYEKKIESWKEEVETLKKDQQEIKNNLMEEYETKIENLEKELKKLQEEKLQANSLEVGTFFLEELAKMRDEFKVLKDRRIYKRIINAITCHFHNLSNDNLL